MTIAEFRAKIENHAPGSLIPRDCLVELLRSIIGATAGVENWVDIERAAEITGEKQERLRYRATGWREMPSPPVRVTKNDPDNYLSRWLFAEEDCWTYARRKGLAQPQPTSCDDTDPADTDAIADSYVERIVSSL